MSTVIKDETVCSNKDIGIYGTFRLSTVHEARPFHLLNGMPSEEALPPRWSRSSALLYALSILVI